MWAGFEAEMSGGAWKMLVARAWGAFLGNVGGAIWRAVSKTCFWPLFEKEVCWYVLVYYLLLL
jgi:hypothetical protein